MNSPLILSYNDYSRANAEKKEKVKKELDGASEEMEKFRIMAAELMNLDKQARANANNKHTMTKKK